MIETNTLHFTKNLLDAKLGFTPITATRRPIFSRTPLETKDMASFVNKLHSDFARKTVMEAPNVPNKQDLVSIDVLVKREKGSRRFKYKVPMSRGRRTKRRTISELSSKQCDSSDHDLQGHRCRKTCQDCISIKSSNLRRFSINFN